MNKKVFAIMFLSLVCCQSIDITQLPEKEAFEYLNSQYEDESTLFEENIQKFQGTFPYSAYLDEVLLMQADFSFARKRYAESIVYYRDYIRKYPKSPQKDKTTFRIAQAYDLQSSDFVDREQLLTEDALLQYSLYLKDFPEGKFHQEAKERKEILSLRLAEHELFIASYYLDKDAYHSSYVRFLNIIQKFKHYPEILKKAQEGFTLSEQKIKEYEKENPESKQFLKLSEIGG